MPSIPSLRFFHLFLFLLSILSVNASRGTTVGANWITHGRSALVQVRTPDLPVWNEEEQIGEANPKHSLLILNFTLSHDSSQLLLQDQPFLPLPNPFLPPQLEAHQQQPDFIPEWRSHENYRRFLTSPTFALDYERLVHPRDDPNIRYYSYAPTLTLNLLGAGIAGYNTLLESQEQQIIRVEFKDHNTNPGINNFTITRIGLFPRHRGHAGPENLKECTLWSWACPDFGDPPWYRYVYRQNFDEYGRIGSRRHLLLQRWSNLVENVGIWRVIGFLVLLAGMILVPVVYKIYRGMRWVVARYKSIQARRVDFYDPDEDEVEAEGLLLFRDEVEDMCFPPENGEKAIFSGSDLEAGLETLTSVEKPLPPVPASTSMSQVETI